MTDINMFPTRVLRAHNRFDQSVAMLREQQDDIVAELEDAARASGLPWVRWCLDPKWGFTGVAEGATCFRWSMWSKCGLRRSTSRR